MLYTLLRPRSILGRRISPWRQCLSTTVSRRHSDPLRILFCGSDEFSCASLRAIHEEHVKNKGLIESLDVMVLSPKRAGRGNKTVREVPIKLLADNLGLQIHQRSTFREWDLPEATNLIIAVSFGLFVPPRILKSAKYGGLNVHPSLLPDLRGPAPIHHAILHGHEYTGVSLQTLDEKAFDHGTVLAQTPAPGIAIPPTATAKELTAQLAPIGAQMLVQGLRDGVHLSKQPAGWKGTELEGKELVHAPKVDKADGHVDWNLWTGADFERRIRALGSVWTRAIKRKGAIRRLIFQDAKLDLDNDAGNNAGNPEIVTFVQRLEGDAGESQHKSVFAESSDGTARLSLSNGDHIRLRRIKEEAKPERDAAVVLNKYTPLWKKQIPVRKGKREYWK